MIGCSSTVATKLSGGVIVEMGIAMNVKIYHTENDPLLEFIGH